MANNGKAKVRNRSGEAISPTPDWPTTMRRRLTGGRCEGVDGSMWLFGKIPLSPVVDARDPDAAYEASLPITAFVEEVAAATPVRGKMRQLNRNAYREIQFLLVNVPRIYEPPAGHPNAVELAGSFRHIRRYERLLLTGVRLRDQLGGDGGGMRSYIHSVTQTLTERRPPVSDFDGDWATMRDALARAGAVEPTGADFHLANSWWNSGYSPDIPLLIESDHVHAFTKADALNAAARLVEQGTACEDWPAMVGTFPLSFGVIEEYEQSAMLATSSDAQFVPGLLASGAAAVSVRAFVEPAKVTRFELRRNRAKAMRDITERVEAGKMDHGEQEMLLGNLTQAEDSYATDNPPASLIEVSTVVAFTGKDQHRGFDLTGIGNHVELNNMVERQEAAWYEMMLCSDVRANPHLHDLPSTRIACSGLPSLSTVGDKDGALLGFTERDRQPAYVSPTAASTADGLPMGLVVAQTGGGKTQLLLWLAHQFGKAKRPVVIFDPKIESDHTLACLLSGGQVASLDDLVSADGVFDPLRFAATPQIGVELATSMLLSVNPWGLLKDDYEVEISSALTFGVENGATCIGQALSMARAATQDDGMPLFPAKMIDQVFKLANSSSLFRAIVGIDPQTKPLSVSDGITLIKVGRTHLDMPSEGSATATTITQRVTLALIRMVVLGSAMAMAGRDGVLLIDEFWTVLTGGFDEVDRLGRVARSQRVLPIGFTQKVSDAVNAGLTGYISRGFIGPFQDREQAIQACELFKLDPTNERLDRMTAKDTRGEAPNFESFRALRDPISGRFVRGAVFIYSDLNDRAVPVEITIPPWFIKVASTNPGDIDRRQAMFAQVKLAWPEATDKEVAEEVVRRLSPNDPYLLSLHQDGFEAEGLSPRPERLLTVEDVFTAPPATGQAEEDVPLVLRDADSVFG